MHIPRTPRRAGSHPLRLVLPTLLALSGCGPVPGAGGEILFGMAVPTADEYGQNAVRGARLAVREVNDAGGVGGDTVRLLLMDDGGEERRAIAVAHALVDSARVLAVVGHNNSGPLIAAAREYDRGRLAALGISATSPEISRLGPWIFRVAPSDSANAVALARATARGSRRVGVMYANEDYGRSLGRVFEAAFRALGGEVVQMDPYLESTPDFLPYLERLRRQGVSTVFVAGNEEGAGRIIPQAGRIGYAASFVGGDGIENLARRGPAYEGTHIGVLFHPDASPAARRFAQAYRDAYGREPDSSAALAYDAVGLLVRAVRDGARSRDAVRGYLEGVGREGGSPPYAGAADTVRFDANGDPVRKSFVVGTARGGRIVLGE